MTAIRNAAACPRCGGWTTFGGMSHKAECTSPRVCQQRIDAAKAPKLTAAARRVLAAMQGGAELINTRKAAVLFLNDVDEKRTSRSIVEQLSDAGLIDGHFHGQEWTLTDAGASWTA